MVLTLLTNKDAIPLQALQDVLWLEWGKIRPELGGSNSTLQQPRHPLALILDT